MPLQFAGEFEVQRSLEEVYDFLTDPHRFGPLLPYFQGLAVADERNFEVKVRVGISHIRGTADVKLNLAEADRPRRLAYRGRGSLAGGSVDFNAGFDLQTNGNGSKVIWRGEAQVFGVLTSIAGGLLQPLAQKNAARAIEGLRAALEPAGVRGQGPGVSSQPPVVSGPSPVVSGQLSVVSGPVKENETALQGQSAAGEALVPETPESKPATVDPEPPGQPEVQ